MSDFKDIIYNCRQATYLIEKRELIKLTFKEQIELRMHLVGCDMCKLYVKQSRKINEMVKQLLKSDMRHTIRLDDDFKNALQTQIDDQLNKN
ncbi:hypothetical protein [Mucilaginibacter glaciei]|uniref:Zf-HC2 domain-containing protein n=1 Tax=Mucilaginibacter glaciei TaxID=2772109 RepID=A0A926NN34_9SPHI|nr:hypothetical protein [Mucilaginibacter glaciei]MBD1394206.1 hypothetical protein [Mucilaginibacter glaciei]